MAQVKKLQQGETVPKQYGHLIIDGIDLGNTEEVYKAFAEYAKQQNLNQGEFYAQWLAALRNGEDVIFGNGNTVNIKPENMSEKRAGERSGLMKFIDATLNDRRNHFSNGIATARLFNFTPKTKEDSNSGKTTRYNDKYDFDYNGTGKDAVYSVTNPGNIAVRDRFNHYLDWLDNEAEWEKANDFKSSLNDKDKVGLRAWYNHFQPGEGIDTESNPGWRREAALAALNEAMATVEATKGGYDNVPEDIRDLLAYFNLGNEKFNTSTTGATGSGTGDPADDRFDANGRPKADARTKTGGYVIGKGNDGNYYINFNVGQTPYLITRNDWNRLGLNGQYEFLRNAVIDSDGRFWTQDQLAQATDNPLYEIMESIRSINDNTGISGADRYAMLNQMQGINWAGKGGDYNQFDYTPDTYYSLNDSLRELLKNYKNISIFDASRSFGFEDGNLLGYYDNSQKGGESWGFRAPFYLRRNPDGSFTSVTEQELVDQGNPYVSAAVNMGFDSNGVFSAWQSIMNGNKNQYALVATVEGKDTDKNGNKRQYQIYIGRDGKFYHKKNDTTLIEIDPDLMEFIRKGGEPSNKQMDEGTLSGNSKKFNEYAKNAPVYHAVGLNTGFMFKEGGSIEKHQIGQNIGGPVVGVTDVEVADSPLQQASNLKDSLTEADWKEISAAAIDLGGAIAGLVPGGSIVGAISGLGSTTLYLSAAKDRKGKRDLSDWGQAGLATVLDAISIIPYVGEAGKLAKIGKGIAKIATPLSKVFNAIGLAHLVPTLTKNPKNWTSDDLINLSTGLTAALNVGHSMHTARGDSKLAHEISKIRSTDQSIKPQHSKKMKVGDVDSEMILQPGEVEKIVGSKTPGEELKQMLKARGVSDDQLGDMNQLLKDFGFDVSGRISIKKDHRTKAAISEGYKNPEYSKYGYLGDQFKVFSNPELKRREYIDLNMGDAKVREKINQLAKRKTNSNTITRRALNDEITETTFSREFESPAISRAYAQSALRLGEENARFNWAKHIWRGAESDLPTTTETIVRRGPTNAQLETIPSRMSDEALQMTRSALDSPDLIERAIIGDRSPRTIAEVTGFNPSKDRSLRLGANSMSNKEIADWANNRGIAPNGEKVTVDDVVALLESLPEKRRWSLINYFTNNTKGKNTREAADRFRISREKGTETIQDIRRRINNASAVKDKDAKAAFDEARNIANSLITLRESKDPMKTLRLLSQKKGFDQTVFDHPEEFREALEYALKHGVYGKMNDKQKHQYDFELNQLMEGRNLLFKQGGTINFDKINEFAKGGIIKAQPGTKVSFWNNNNLFDENGIWDPYTQVPYAASTGPTGIRVPTDFNPNWRLSDYLPEVKFQTVDVKIPEVNTGTKTTTTTQTPKAKSTTTPTSTTSSATTPAVATTQTSAVATPTAATAPQTASTTATTTPQTARTPVTAITADPRTFLDGKWINYNNQNPNADLDLMMYDFIKQENSEIGKYADEITQDTANRLLKEMKDGRGYGDPNTDPTPFWTNFIKNGYKGAQYLSQAIGREKNFDVAKRTAWNTYHRQTTPFLQGISTATPIEDAAVDYWTNQSQRGPIVNATANAITNNTIWNQHQQQSEQGRAEALRQLSQAALAREQYNQQIHNQQAQLDAAAENDSKARISGIHQIIGDAEQKRNLEKYTSLGNAIMEDRIKFENQLQTINKMQYQRDSAKLSEEFNNSWKGYIRQNHPTIQAAWDALSASEKANYANDITDWLQQSEYWPDLQKEFDLRQNKLSGDLRNSYIKNIVDPLYAKLYSTERYGVPGQKKGGKVGGNRYKNEPWEDIWINKNKAVHSAIAKLNDNTIKVFLKTLK